MKIKFKNSIRKLSFLCRLPDIKIAWINPRTYPLFRSSHPEMFLVKRVLKICSKFTGEHSCQSVISMMLQSNFTETILLHGCSPVNLLHISEHFFLGTSLGGCF